MGELTILACVKNNDTVMHFVTAELMRQNFCAPEHPDILVAVEEIFVNIAHYSTPPAEAVDVDITVWVEDGVAAIRFEDTGRSFNPHELAAPNLDVSLMERKIGGLGWHFVKNLMDRLEYEYTDGKNIVTIFKNPPSEGVAQQ